MMKGKIENLEMGVYKCSVYLPVEHGMDDREYPVLYINGEYELEEIIGGVEP